MEYFVVMVDYGRLGMEANVHPENTANGALDKVIEALSDGKRVAFVHHVHDGVCEDVTEEMIKNAWEALEVRAA